MKTDIKKVFLSLAFVFFSLSAFAVSLEDFSLSVEPLFGLKYGHIDEYVFLKKSNYSDDKLSELNWEIKPELYYGMKVRGCWRMLFCETGLSFGIPMDTGLLQDSDWFNAMPATMGGGVSAENAAGRDYKTNYSESDNHLDYDIQFGIKGGFELAFLKRFKAQPALAFDYTNISFTGKNGIAWYGKKIESKYYAPYSDSKNQDIYTFGGKRVITYNRVSYYLWLGSDFSAELPHNIELNTGFFFAPYVYAVSYDSHTLKNTDYADLTTGFFGAFKWNLGVTYNITEKHSVSLSASYFYMRVLRGKDYEKSSSETSYNVSSECEGGAGAKWFDVTLSYRFTIF